MIAIEAYVRRRGWLAWHVAALGRFEFEQGFPELESMTGQASERAGPTDDHLAHKLRLWKAAFGQLEE